MRASCAVLGLVLLGGCAASQETFYRSPGSLSDLRLCRTWQDAEGQFSLDVQEEAARRRLAYADCRSIVASAAVLGAGAVLAGWAGGVRGAGAYSDGVVASQRRSPPVATVDREWDWDEFYDEPGRLVWACRGVQSGQFADEVNCFGLPKVDIRWPDKRK